MKIVRTMSICCLSVIFLVTSFPNIVASVWCIEDNGHAKMEFACNPCCSNDDNKCSEGNTGIADGDHVGCENCTDFPVEKLGRLQTLSTKRFASKFGITVPSISPVPLSAFAIAGGYSLGPPVILSGLGVTQASLVVLRC